MKILGIDPGYDRLGIAVIEKGPRDALLYSSCFQTSSQEPIYARLRSIGDEVGRVLDVFSPEALAIENLYITKNQKTAMRVAEARGIILYEAEKRGIPIHEYTPMQIKSAVTGDGASDKRMIEKMIRLLVAFPPSHGDTKALDDEYDAIAVALTCSAHAGSRLSTEKSVAKSRGS
jgi:crossover junction endodeoxyribonuclease RuvC